MPTDQNEMYNIGHFSCAFKYIHWCMRVVLTCVIIGT